jgi:hypothetical protein
MGFDWEYRRINVIRGGLVYAVGDTLAALILHDFSWTRMLGIALVGATVYAFEVPNYFRWIARVESRILRTGLAILYFNPLWVARHLAFVALFSGVPETIGLTMLRTAGYSFAVNIPISLSGNYLIQNKVPLSWRFLASSVFSGLMALYYALSAVWFGL